MNSDMPNGRLSPVCQLSYKTPISNFDGSALFHSYPQALTVSVPPCSFGLSSRFPGRAVFVSFVQNIPLFFETFFETYTRFDFVPWSGGHCFSGLGRSSTVRCSRHLICSHGLTKGSRIHRSHKLDLGGNIGSVHHEGVVEIQRDATCGSFC